MHAKHYTKKRLTVPYGPCNALDGSTGIPGCSVPMYESAHGVYLQGNRGKPGRLSLNPFSHMAQLSVAKDHSPTTTGPNARSIAAIRDF